MLLAGAPLGTTPALAAQPGHVYAFAFGSHGAGTGQFLRPSGVAVNDSSGDIYVSDAAGGRVEEFEPVLNAAGELVGESFLREVKVTSPGQIAVDNCAHDGTTCTTTEDASAGDVYVVGAKKQGGRSELLKFNASLQPLSAIKPKERAVAVAIDPKGTVFLAEAGERRMISVLDDAEPNVVQSSVTARIDGQLQSALAVDSGDGLYVAHLPSESEGGESGTPLSNLYQELAGEDSELEADGGRAWLVSKIEAGTGTPLGVLGFEPAGAVAVDAGSGEVYAADVATVAGQTSTTVGVFAPTEGEGAQADAGQLIERLSAPGLEESAGLAVSATSGAVYVADPGSSRVYVFDPEERATSFTHGVPRVSEVSATPAGGGAITLSAQVSSAGAPTTAHFEYGAAACPSGCASTAPTPVGSGFGAVHIEAQLPSVAPGAYDLRVVAENALGSTVSAGEPFSIAASLGVLPDGRAWELVTPPNEGGAEPNVMSEGGAGVIQAAENGDAITYVADGPMPASSEVEGARGPESNQILSARSPTWTSRDINTPYSTGAGTDIGEPPEYQFFSSDLALALVRPFAGAAGALASPPLSPPVSGEEDGNRKQENTIYLHADTPGPEAGENVLQPEPSERVSYEQALANGEEENNQGFVPLVTQLNEPNPEYGERLGTSGGLEAEGATGDLSHVVLASTLGARPGLYEWVAPSTANTEAPLQPVSVLPEDMGGALVGLGATLGGPFETGQKDYEVSHAISEDGSLVFWSYAGQLYVRDTDTKQSLLLSGGLGGEHAVFQTARPDGSQVFFTDDEPLTPESTATLYHPDLYVADISLAGGQLSRQLSDLTAQSRESAGVLVQDETGGGVIGVGEPLPDEAPIGSRGSYVYFVDDAALAPGAHRGHCGGDSDTPRPAGTTCNLYVRHYDEASGQWEPTKLVAALSAEDSPDWQASVEPGNAAFETARVSPNGRYLAFMSDRSLTGYDNIDVDEEGGKHADEEVYLYDAAEAGLVCASCNPSGARPAGIFDPGNGVNTGEGLGLLADRRGVWGPELPGVARWLAANVPGWTPLSHHGSDYQSRYLSNSGRLFFDSPDRLVPDATGSKEKVYEYEPDGVGECTSSGGCVGLISAGDSEHEAAFIDASANGNDVFFVSFDRLTPLDLDGALEIYDAHVCAEGGCPPPAATPPAQCQEEACQGIFEEPPSASPSGSSVLLGSGNLQQATSGVLGESSTMHPKPHPKPLTRAQKLKRALASCRRRDAHRNHARTKCETRARRSYGPVKHAAKKSSSGR